MMRQVAVILDIAEEGWEQCLDHIRSTLDARGLGCRVMMVHLGGRRSWKECAQWHSQVVSRRDFSRGRPVSAAVDDFCAAAPDVLAVLPSERSDVLGYFLAHSQARLKAGRKEVCGTLADLTVGNPPGGDAPTQEEVFDGIIDILERFVWK